MQWTRSRTEAYSPPLAINRFNFVIISEGIPEKKTFLLGITHIGRPPLPPKLILTLFQKWKKSPKLCVGHGRGKRCFFLGVLPLARDLTASNHHHLCPFSIIITVNITKTIIIVTNIIFRPQTYISLNLETRYATSLRRTPLMRFLFNINDGF